MAKRIPVKLVDAFTRSLFGGNPAGVVSDARDLSEEQMQLIAREIGFSETAFVTGGRDGEFDVRFFTPTREVDLCGHATIATFWVLAEEGVLDLSRGEITCVQNTRAGSLEVQVWGAKGRPNLVVMEQRPPSVQSRLDWEEPLPEILGLERTSLRDMPVPRVVSTGLPDLIVPVESRDILWNLTPDIDALEDFCLRRDIISVHCFTVDAEEGFDAHCRDFSPAVGIPEEAATGTASGATAAYMIWEDMLPINPETKDITITLEQGRVLGRPSQISCRVELENRAPIGVKVGGAAVTFLEGRMPS